ncbi:MAG TPA: ATP-binding cassette domain-containing protein [Bryobacteraceae bacterium]|nr:ATP-binding cassette domain-containing protein [Bryobacteraceae bacterium]
MGVPVRTEELRKIYYSPPPAAAAGFRGLRRRSASRNAKNVHVVALDGVSLEVEAGEIFGLLGPNGAGKSTTIGILTTRVCPTSGRAWIGAYDVWAEQVEAKRLIGVVQQRPNLDFSLTAREILLFHGAYYGLPSAERVRRCAALLERFQLSDRADELVRGFSGGMMQRLSIARAMMHDPEVLFLDEPSTGLDPQTRLLLWEIVREYNRGGKTILLTTHNMDEADELSHRIAIIDHGRVIALDTPAGLKASIPGGYLLRLRFNLPAPGISERLRALRGVTEVRVEGAGVDLYAGRGGSLIPEIVAVAAEAGADLCDVHISEPSLETLFLHHTGRSLRQ